MVYLIVTLDVKDFDAFERFERSAAEIMTRYGGEIQLAVELSRDAHGGEYSGGQELHVVVFPDEASFDAYRSDEALAALAPLRESAIVRTQVRRGSRRKSYHVLSN